MDKKLKNCSEHGGIVKTVLWFIGLNASLCVLTICFCTIFSINVEERVFTALVGIAGNLVGYITGMLTRTTQNPNSENNPLAAKIVNDLPVKTEVTNPDPIPVTQEETPKTRKK